MVTDKILECYVDINLDITSNHEVIRFIIYKDQTKDTWNFYNKFDFKKINTMNFLSMLQAENNIITTTFLILKACKNKISKSWYLYQ